MDSSLHKRLEELLSRLLDGELDVADQGDLTAILRDDPQARAAYREHIALHAMLYWKEGQPLEGRSAASQPAPRRAHASASPILGFLGDIGRQGWGFVSGHSSVFSVLAVLLAVTVLVAVAVRNADFAGQNAVPQIADLHPEISDPKSPPAPNPQSLIPNPQSPTANPQSPIPNPSSSPVARLVRTSDCRWNGQAFAPQIGQPLPAGQSLHLTAGVAEFEFDVGARVILQSPASLQLLSANAARLEIGKATVEITAEKARGFKILTPEAAFIDRGTEFGVEVTPSGNSKIHVFQGQVDVDRKATEGRSAPAAHRLIENAGARMEAGKAGMVLVEDTGECFIRSMDDAGRDRHVVAYWRFEDRPVGTLLPHSTGNLKPVVTTVDSSFNGNDLYTGTSLSQPILSADVCATAVAHTGLPNRSCLDTSQPTGKPDRMRSVYTHSQFSHAAPLDIQRITPAQWTVEASVKAAQLTGKAQGFLGRDATFTRIGKRAPARLTFQMNARDRFAIGFYDANGRFHEVVAEDLPVQPGRWYHLAATSDGRTLRLYVDALDGRGYVQRAATKLPTTGSTALGKVKDNAEWTIGRAGNAGDPADWLRFSGWIDEVRISDVAREPEEFLFTPREKDGGI